MRIAFFGGTFDPPHRGHVELARQVLENGLTDQVLWVPAWSPPHKSGERISLYADRFAMLKLAVAGQPGFAISEIERRLNHRPSYTAEVLEALDREYPNDQIQLMIGGDSLAQLSSWHRGRELAEHRELIVYPRHGLEPDWEALQQLWGPEIVKNLQKKVLNLPFFEISSTEIRKKVAKNENTDKLLVKSVCQYIQDHNLYRER